MTQDKITIIGAGVSGINTGLVLQLLGYQTQVYAEYTIEDFNSLKDPAFSSRFPAASIIPHTVFSDQLEALFLQSQRMFYRLRMESFKGLTLHKHYEVFEIEQRYPPWLDWMFNVRTIEDQPDVPRRSKEIDLTGWVFDCFFADWPVYFSYLNQLYLESGGLIQKKKLRKEDILEIPAEIIINCSGLGSSKLFEDEATHEIGRGHLLFVKDAPLYRNRNSEIVSYNYTPKAEIYSDRTGEPMDVYWYPRKDGWILGGSRQFGSLDKNSSWKNGGNTYRYYSVNDLKYPRQIWDVNSKILKNSYGLDLETYSAVSAFKGYRYIRSRKNGLRLEKEKLENKVVIHNYGHGGAGVTLSWGSALHVAQLLASIQNSSSDGRDFGTSILKIIEQLVKRELNTREYQNDQ